MNKKILCRCDQEFEQDIPGHIDLDSEPDYEQAIVDGSFMSFRCPSCSETIKPEIPLSISWPSKNLVFEIIPETERCSYYHRKEFNSEVQTIIGYPELRERVLVLENGLEPLIIEAIKYYLLLKAEESNPDAEVDAWFHALHTINGNKELEFYLDGLRKNEVAVSMIPCSFYEKILSEYSDDPAKEPFKSLSFGSYLSIQNLLRPEELT